MADRHVSHLLGVPHAQLNEYIRLLSFYQMRKALDPSTRIPASPAFKLEAESEDHAKMKVKRVDQTQQNALFPAREYAIDAFSHWLSNPETDHLASAERYGWRLVDCEQVLDPVACTEFGERDT
jgi:hypothetical protein